ncbi:DEKNAAC100753 [Brettanomyces naardenensis]|uniref:DEKNAAC100753 n=1 Tax=Brettanomyces naardenensis TaxID=13370 RepID=A0A448YG22_BRENA|nr:DEKNAAC100753 [Brettanomyces naardenensis]
MSLNSPTDTVKSTTAASGSVNVTPSLELLNPGTPDSTVILSDRYDKYLKLITTVERFAENYMKIASANVKLNDQLSKNTLNKDLPNFEASPDGASAVSGSANADITANASDPTSTPPAEGEMDLNVFVYSLRRNITTLYNSSVQLESQIRTEVLPPLKTLYSEVESRKKEFLASSSKHQKELGRLRTSSAKDIRKLGASISLFNTDANRADYRRDPYILKRSLINNAVTQVQNENDYVDFLENNERALKALESQILVILQDTFNTMSKMVANYYGNKSVAFQSVNNVFQGIPTDKEWNNFVAKNGDYLVSTQSTDSSDVVFTQALANVSLSSLATPAAAHHGNKLKRSYENLQFAGKDDASTTPILEGNLAKKEGSLKKKYNTYYYVITRSKFLLELPTGAVDTSSPTLVLYLPDCSLLQAKQDGKFKFTLRGKDASNILKVRKRDYSFKASSGDEFLTWYNVISAVNGLMVTNEEQRNAQGESNGESDEEEELPSATAPSSSVVDTK